MYETELRDSASYSMPASTLQRDFSGIHFAL